MGERVEVIFQKIEQNDKKMGNRRENFKNQKINPQGSISNQDELQRLRKKAKKKRIKGKIKLPGTEGHDLLS